MNRTGLPRGGGDDRTVDSAGKKTTQRHVGNKLPKDGLNDFFSGFHDGLGLRTDPVGESPVNWRRAFRRPEIIPARYPPDRK